eukprot:g38564.t1
MWVHRDCSPKECETCDGGEEANGRRIASAKQTTTNRLNVYDRGGCPMIRFKIRGAASSYVLRHSNTAAGTRRAIANPTHPTFCELAGDIDPDSRFEGPRAEITSESITKEYMQELEKKELKLRKLLIERLSPSDRVFIFHEVQHIIQDIIGFTTVGQFASACRLYIKGDDLLEHAAKVPRLERMAKRNRARYSGHDIDLTRYAYRARYPYRI